MLDEKTSKRFSKFLSYVLRHHPELIGITMDQNGWVSVSELIEKANHFGQPLTKEILEFVVDTNNKKRFAFDETHEQIRAAQGHSLAIELGHESQEPPTLLYHGTAVSNVASIRANGIQKQSRQHVHLSEQLATATQVGQRHGKPVVLTVRSGDMHRANFPFFLSENGVWLTEFVPPEYLNLD